MQIFLTKKLAEAMGIKPAPANNSVDPLFSWTANWTNTFDRRKEDMVVMVNNATRFTVLIYGVKRNQFKDIEAKMTAAIRNTLLAMNLNMEMVDDYLRQAGELQWSANNDRKLTAWVNRKCLDAAFVAGRAENESQGRMKYNDTLGRTVSREPVNYSKGFADSYVPAEKMTAALTELTGKPAYKYRAFELLVSLDLEIYKAVRRLIVPANIKFADFHKLLQNVFGWENYHLHDFAVYDEKGQKLVARIVMSEEELDHDSGAVLEEGCKLSYYFPKHKYMLYTYDMGDCWDHKIELVRVIDEHNAESPYLLEAVGQTPPEDVGGVGGFIDFREIMLNPDHPDYAETKKWAGYWSPDLWEWKSRPQVIHI